MAREEHTKHKGFGGVDGSVAAGAMFRSWSLGPSTPKVESKTDASGLCFTAQASCKTQVGGYRT